MVGLRIKNDYGVYQIDGSRPNFQLRQSGSGTCNTSQTVGGGTVYKTQITVNNCISPMIALSNNSNPVCSFFISISGSTWTFTIMSRTNNTTFNYYVFDQGVNVTGNAGLRIYNSSGILLYQTGGKPIRISGSAPGTYTSGRSYAVIQTSNGLSWTADDLGGGTIAYSSTLGYITVSSNVVSVTDGAFENYTYSGTPGYSDSYSDLNYGIIVVDVTNY
ncbi:hypothetical protein EBZ38_01760 [bacterium]|nr:hypothetical protein [bacterium]